MNWRKEFGTDNLKNMEYVLVVMVVFSVIGIFLTDRPPFSSQACLLLIT